MFFNKELLVVYMGLLLSLDDAVDETFLEIFAEYILCVWFSGPESSLSTHGHQMNLWPVA